MCTSIILSLTLVLFVSTTGFAEEITQDSLNAIIESKGERVIRSMEKPLLPIVEDNGGMISPMKTAGLSSGGNMYLYLVDGGGGLWWEGAHAVLPLTNIRALTESVAGAIYKKSSTATKWTLTDSDADSDTNTYSGVYTETGENQLARGAVGSYIRVETIGSLTTILGNDTDSMDIEYKIQ